MRYAKVGQIKWMSFWLALICGPDLHGLWVVWIISLFLSNKD